MKQTSAKFDYCLRPNFTPTYRVLTPIFHSVLNLKVPVEGFSATLPYFQIMLHEFCIFCMEPLSPTQGTQGTIGTPKSYPFGRFWGFQWNQPTTLGRLKGFHAKDAKFMTHDL